MAENLAAWGIEIGNAGLKALKLKFSEGSSQALAVAFDYVPHEKLLSLPDANPDELIATSLQTFLSRNPVQQDLVSVSVPGKDSFSKFVQLPPVDMKRVAEIVKFEAKQQVPFPLEEVFWDWQPLGAGGAEAGGFLVDAEVGIFAMRKELVYKHLQPYLSRKVELEVVQVAPMALYNFVTYDRLGRRIETEEDESAEYTVILDMGCDATSLMVTNGKKIWTRNVSVGGNHFTRALTKEMKLTFTKAEHLKCNATKSPDPRAVFQAMKPVFNDFVTEIQRSIGAFSSVNRSARITRIVGVGNGFRLAGLQKYLQQNLNYEVDRVETFNHLVGDNVLAAPLFQENILTFAVPYGLALQALQKAEIKSSLLPPEIVIKRTIRKKKPWAVVAAASLLAGFTLSTFGYGMVAQSVSEGRFGAAEKICKDAGAEATTLKGKYTTEEGTYAATIATGDKLVPYTANREQWLELYRTINECLPRDTGVELDSTQLTKMHRITVQSITTKRYDDVKKWFDGLNAKGSVTAKHIETYMDEADAKTPPTGKAFVVTLPGYHFHTGQLLIRDQLHAYVKNTLLYNLQAWRLTRTNPQSGEVIEAPVREMGISHAVIVDAPNLNGVKVDYWPYGPPKAAAAPARPGLGGLIPTPMPAAPVIPQLPGQEARTSQPEKVVRTDFVIQFVWKPTPVKDRKPAPADATLGGQPSQVLKPLLDGTVTKIPLTVAAPAEGAAASTAAPSTAAPVAPAK